MQLHWRDQHPIGILKNAIFESYNDTYYIDAQSVLRCHTSAHQAELLRRGHPPFLVTGDAYCRDSIDLTHYPVFHQMEGVRVFSPDDWEASGVDATSYAAEDLKKCLEGLQVTYLEKQLEVLVCGVTEQEILKRSGKMNNVAWAFGLGLERLAMVLFDIPDIRLFWSNNERFTSQFSKGHLGVKFKTFSKLVSELFWLYVYRDFIIIFVVIFFLLFSFAWYTLLRHSRAYEPSSDCGHHCIFMGAGGLIWHFLNFQEMMHLSHAFRQFYKVLPWTRAESARFGPNRLRFAPIRPEPGQFQPEKGRIRCIGRIDPYRPATETAETGRNRPKFSPKIAGTAEIFF
ncbi:hypothetical protein SO802_011074 [Lithocarpus litseifolius]|uniref:Phenylalanyl-tRNA synthetase domain-containing protein n=1 Tax=Lithocarpus litseifolius TaxID=425828 RepID=A0AAW2DI91_9ROSI